MKIAKDSKSWIFSSFIIGLIFLILAAIAFWSFISAICLFISIILFFISLFMLIFFRDPDRTIGEGIVASADGKIREICNLKDDDVGNCIKISTFMNINNVHVNRLPFGGKIIDIEHKSGHHIPAFKKESEKNERVIITFDTDIGLMKIIQIAGTIARRIVPYVSKKDKLKKGEKIGIIRFGSRVDVYLPNNKISIMVKVGDIVKAGVTTIAKIND